MAEEIQIPPFFSHNIKTLLTGDFASPYPSQSQPLSKASTPEMVAPPTAAVAGSDSGGDVGASGSSGTTGTTSCGGGSIQQSSAVPAAGGTPSAGAGAAGTLATPPPVRFPNASVMFPQMGKHGDASEWLVTGASRYFGSRKIGFERSLLCTVKQGRAGCQTVDKDVTVTVINIEQGVRKLTEDVTVTVSPWSQTGPGSARTHAQEKI